MFFNVNYDEKESFELIPKNTVLEVKVTSIFQDATPKGTQYIRVNYQVRNDLDNASPSNKRFKNRYLNTSFWPSKESGQFEGKRFLQLLEACNVPQNTQIKDFGHLESLVINKNVRVKVTTTKNDEKGTEYNDVAFFNITKTKYPTQAPTTPDFSNQQAPTQTPTNNANQQGFTDPFADSGNTINVTDDDLPF